MNLTTCLGSTSRLQPETRTQRSSRRPSSEDRAAEKQRRMAIERCLMADETITIGLKHAEGMARIPLRAADSVSTLKIQAEMLLGVPPSLQEICTEPNGTPLRDGMCLAQLFGGASSSVLYLTEMLPGAPQEEEDLNLIAQQSIPEPEEEWLCPITRDVIYCPVLLNQQVYELDALAGWLAKHPTNPLTRAPFDYDTSLVVDTELRGLMATWRHRAVKSHRECAGACSSDASRVAYHLAAALEADPRDVESYSLLATHLEVEGDQHAAVEVRAEGRKMSEGLHQASRAYALSASGDHATVVPCRPEEETEDEELREALLGLHQQREIDEDPGVGPFFALLAVAQMSKACVWGIVANSAVTSATTTAAAGGTGAVATVGAGAVAGTMLAAGAAIAATIGGAYQVQTNRQRKRRAFSSVQRMLGRRR